MKKLKRNQLKLDKEVITSLSKDDLYSVIGGVDTKDIVGDSGYNSCFCTKNGDKCASIPCMSNIAEQTCPCVQTKGNGGLVQATCAGTCACVHSQAAGCAPSETCYTTNV